MQEDGNTFPGIAVSSPLGDTGSILQVKASTSASSGEFDALWDQHRVPGKRLSLHLNVWSQRIRMHRSIGVRELAADAGPPEQEEEIVTSPRAHSTTIAAFGNTHFVVPVFYDAWDCRSRQCIDSRLMCANHTPHLYHIRSGGVALGAPAPRHREERWQRKR